MNRPPAQDPETWPPAPTERAGAPSATAAPPSWWDRLRAAPPELALFAVFSLVVSLSLVCLAFVGPKPWRDALALYIGSSSGFAPYLSCLFFLSQLILSPDTNPKARSGVIVILLLSSAFGVWNYLTLVGRPSNFHNPYLTARPWQPVWTVALPLAWALALGLGPVVRRRSARQPAA